MRKNYKFMKMTDGRNLLVLLKSFTVDKMEVNYRCTVFPFEGKTLFLETLTRFVEVQFLIKDNKISLNLDMLCFFKRIG